MLTQVEIAITGKLLQEAHQAGDLECVVDGRTWRSMDNHDARQWISSDGLVISNTRKKPALRSWQRRQWPRLMISHMYFRKAELMQHYFPEPNNAD